MHDCIFAPKVYCFSGKRRCWRVNREEGYERKYFILWETITSLLEAKKYSTLRDVLIMMNPSDIALLFEEIPEGRFRFYSGSYPRSQAADTFVEMDSDAQELLIRGLSDNELKEVVDELYVDDAVDIVEEMPANVVKRILRQADPETRKTINEILKYPEDSAAAS